MVELLPLGIFAYLLIFARIGAILMILPGIGERTVPMRMRLSIALLLSYTIAPSVAQYLPAPPAQVLMLAGYVMGEALIGILIGGLVRLAFNSLQIAGTIISFQSGLAYARSFDPTLGRQSSVIGAFLAILGVTLIFATNVHHVMFVAAANSYTLFSPGAPLPVDSFAKLAVSTTAKTFSIGLQMASPFIVFGLVFYASIGVLSKLMPQVQIFFIAMPANIMIGFVILSLVLSSIMMLFLEHFGSVLETFLP